MKNNMTYCSSNNCLHKLGCKRNLINYTVLDGIKLSMINEEECINVPETEMPYQYLIRFRNSDGSKLK